MLKRYHMQKFLFCRKRNPIAKPQVDQFGNVLRNFVCLQTCQKIFLSLLWGEISFYEFHGHSGFHKLSDFKGFVSAARLDAIFITQKFIFFLSFFLLKAFNIAFPNYENGCLSYTPSFLGMKNVGFGFLYFASGVLFSYVLKWDLFQTLDT